MKDLILGPIVGGLADSSAHLWGRSNEPGIFRAWLGREQDLADARLAGISEPLRVEDGFVGVAPVRDLESETTYYYDLRIDDR